MATAIAGSFIGMILKAAFLLVCICAGIFFGKMYRDKKNAKEALESRKS